MQRMYPVECKVQLRCKIRFLQVNGQHVETLVDCVINLAAAVLGGKGCGRDVEEKLSGAANGFGNLSAPNPAG